MKKFLFVLPALVLAGCDRPTSEADMICLHNSRNDIPVHVKTYKDYALVNWNGQKIKMQKDKEEDYNTFLSIFYTNQNPTQDIPSVLRINIHKETSFVDNYSTYFDNRTNHSYGCYVHTKYNGKITKVDPAKECIENIESTVNQENSVSIYGRVRYLSENDSESLSDYITIPTADAIKISKNWDPENFKKYTLLEDADADYKKDACDVLERLKKYISDNNIQTERMVPMSEMNPIKKCALDICDIVRVTYDDNGNPTNLQISQRIRKFNTKGKYINTDDANVSIPAADAIQITPNWDPNNMKLYQCWKNNIEEYETDACETLERLKKYMSDNNIQKQKNVIVEDTETNE